MAREARTSMGIVGLALVLLGILFVVPFLKRTFPQYYDGFSNPVTDMRVQQLLANGQAESAHPDCIGVTCAEGQFCQRNTCIPIYPGPGDS